MEHEVVTLTIEWRGKRREYELTIVPNVHSREVGFRAIITLGGREVAQTSPWDDEAEVVGEAAHYLIDTWDNSTD